jgi:hypothetical protein
VKRLDADTVFAIFESVHKTDDEVFDPFTHPYVLMGLVVSGVKTFDIIANNYLRDYPGDFDRIYEKVKFLYYDRLYGFLEKIDYTLSLHLIECCKHDYHKVVDTLSLLMKEYERKEEYEKCSRIKNLLDAIVAFQ